jgi:hypothetical protein
LLYIYLERHLFRVRFFETMAFRVTASRVHRNQFCRDCGVHLVLITTSAHGTAIRLSGSRMLNSRSVVCKTSKCTPRHHTSKYLLQIFIVARPLLGSRKSMYRENENELGKSKDMGVFVSARAIRIGVQIAKALPGWLDHSFWSR